jgi:cytoskeleton protein RodZ
VLHQRRSKLVESHDMMSTVTSLVTEPPAAAPRAGAELRAARERLGLLLEDVARTLRIRSPHLEALEEGRISLLPGNAYALAFVRAYAAAIGLDAEEMVRRFRAEAAEFDRRTDLTFPVPMPERGLPAGAVVLLGLLLAVGAYAGWYRLSGEGHLPAEAVTAVPERLASLASQARVSAASQTLMPLTGSTTDSADTAPPRSVLADPPASDTTAYSAPPAAAFSPTSAAAAQPPHWPDDTSRGLSPLSAAASPLPETSRIIVRASADAWLMVKDRSGSILLNRVLKAGETWPVPPRSDLLLTTGNAGGTDLLVDGLATSSLGSAGAVRRDLLLDPDQVKDGKFAGSAAGPLAPTRPRQ